MSRYQAQLAVLGAFVASFLLLSDPTAAAALPRSCAPATSDQIAALSDRWATTLATGNPDAMASLYAEDAVLQSTPEGEPQVGRAAIKSYFERYVRRHPQEVITTRMIVLGCNVASDTGIATTRLTGQRKGTRVATRGQYSTQYEYRGGEWVITRHQVPSIVRTRQAANSDVFSAE